INVGLIDAASRVQVWAERFERPRSERFDLQDEMARAVARQLHVTVMRAEGRRPATPAAAEELVARGWAAMLRISDAGVQNGAEAYFQQALALDPDNVSAQIGIGAFHASVVAMFLVRDPAPHLAQAESMLTKALQLEPGASVGHYFKGILHKTRGEP